MTQLNGETQRTAITSAEAPFRILYSTPDWRDTFGSRADLRCLEGAEAWCDVQLSGLFAQLKLGHAVSSPLSSRDRHGNSFHHLASAAPICSADGSIALLRVTVSTSSPTPPSSNCVAEDLQGCPAVDPPLEVSRSASMGSSEALLSADLVQPDSPGAAASCDDFPPEFRLTAGSLDGARQASASPSEVSVLSEALTERAAPSAAPEPASELAPLSLQLPPAGGSAPRGVSKPRSPRGRGQKSPPSTTSRAPRATGWLGQIGAFEALAYCGTGSLLGRSAAKPGRSSRASSRLGRLGRKGVGEEAGDGDGECCAGEPLRRSSALLAEELVPPPFVAEGGFVVVTAAAPPYVVEWASPGWLQMCGFRPSGLDVLGRSLRCLQGDLTDTAAVGRLMRAVAERRDAPAARLVNYDVQRRVPFVHTVAVRFLPPGDDPQRGAAFIATSSAVQLLLSGAERWSLEAERAAGEVAQDECWSDEFEDYWSGWGERVAPPPKKTEVGHKKR